MCACMVTAELIAIGLILVFQPLIALMWLYLAYRLALGFAAKRAEQFVDGRVNHIEDKLTGDKE